MRYAMIMAGGSGTRLWPMSTAALPKQLIPFIDGKSLLQVAVDRLADLLPQSRRAICAGDAHRQVITERVSGFNPERYYGEPVGRDTVNAVGLVAAVIEREDPDAVIAVFTADHLITPVDRFVQTVERGYQLAEARPNALVTFGIQPDEPNTGYGYLQLGERVRGDFGEAFLLDQFKEKPDTPTAEKYLAAGPSKYLWNSGMFVWRASTLLHCIERFAPENFAGLKRIADAWATPQRDAVLAEVYPTLPKISVDFAVMEPASKDEQVQVAAVPMDVEWIDVGSWTSYAETCSSDDSGNAIGAGKAIAIDSSDNIIASDDRDHLIATLGVNDLVIVHTKHATLICHRHEAQRIKQLHAEVKEKLGEGYV